MTPAGTEVTIASSTVQPEGALARFLAPSLNGVILTISLLVSVRIGMDPLKDNSFLTHLATGRLILDNGAVPTADPYSWSAFGHDWTVQSWLASVIYAGLEDIAGLGAIRLLATALAMSLTLLLWKLTDPADGLLARSVAMALALMIGVGLWVERPLMFGAVGLALVLLAADRRLDPRWMAPLMWFWANTHGSFPFAPVVLVLLAAGRFIDERKRPDVEIRCLMWTVVGIALSVAGPLGTKVLTFPFQLLSRREAFAEIKEWQPIDLVQLNNRIFLIQLLVALVAIVRVRKWRLILPTLVFSIAALTAVRNILQASIVLTPVIATGLAGLGSIAGSRRPRVARPLVHGLAIVIVVFAVMQFRLPHAALGAYPGEALNFARAEGLLDSSSRFLSRDGVGNYVEFAYGPDEVKVFIDDRVDMYPQSVNDAYVGLITAGGDHEVHLRAIDPTIVVWDWDSTFGRWLEASDDWHVEWRDDYWIVAVPAG